MAKPVDWEMLKKYLPKRRFYIPPKPKPWKVHTSGVVIIQEDSKKGKYVQQR